MFAVKMTSSATLLNSKRLHFDESEHLSCFPRRVVRCVGVQHRYRVPCTRVMLGYNNTRDSKAD